jgi:hypothetical protein
VQREHHPSNCRTETPSRRPKRVRETTLRIASNINHPHQRKRYRLTCFTPPLTLRLRIVRPRPQPNPDDREDDPEVVHPARRVRRDTPLAVGVNIRLF